MTTSLQQTSKFLSELTTNELVGWIQLAITLFAVIVAIIIPATIEYFRFRQLRKKEKRISIARSVTAARLLREFATHVESWLATLKKEEGKDEYLYYFAAIESPQTPSSRDILDFPVEDLGANQRSFVNAINLLDRLARGRKLILPTGYAAGMNIGQEEERELRRVIDFAKSIPRALNECAEEIEKEIEYWLRSKR